MKEFIDKLISRLEEKRSEVNGLSDIVWNNAVKMCVDEVNQLAEEYKHCTLCYLQSPCEYQNENAILPDELIKDNNGWIFCIEGKPETIPVPFDNVLICTKEGGRAIGHRCPNQVFGRYYDLHSSAIDNVIAWQPLPPKFELKGE